MVEERSRNGRGMVEEPKNGRGTVEERSRNVEKTEKTENVYLLAEIASIWWDLMDFCEKNIVFGEKVQK